MLQVGDRVQWIGKLHIRRARQTKTNISKTRKAHAGNIESVSGSRVFILDDDGDLHKVDRDLVSRVEAN